MEEDDELGGGAEDDGLPDAVRPRDVAVGGARGGVWGGVEEMHCFL